MGTCSHLGKLKSPPSPRVAAAWCRWGPGSQPARAPGVVAAGAMPRSSASFRRISPWCSLIQHPAPAPAPSIPANAGLSLEAHSPVPIARMGMGGGMCRGQGQGVVHARAALLRLRQMCNFSWENPSLPRPARGCGAAPSKQQATPMPAPSWDDGQSSPGPGSARGRKLGLGSQELLLSPDILVSL